MTNQKFLYPYLKAWHDFKLAHSSQKHGELSWLWVEVCAGNESYAKELFKIAFEAGREYEKKQQEPRTK